MSGNGSALGGVTPISHSLIQKVFIEYLLCAIDYALEVHSEQYTTRSLPHEVYVLERETDSKHVKKNSGSDESDGGHKTGPCDGK